MIKHKKICETLAKLNNCINHIKRNIKLNKIFKKLKCRLRLENKTRWGSAFLVLEAIKKASERGALKTIKLPVSINTIENYLKILRPAYLVNIGFQSSVSSIADVVHNILKLINYWDNFKTNQTGSKLCNLLVSAFKQRFAYELDSKLYQVTNFQLLSVFIK